MRKGDIKKYYISEIIAKDIGIEESIMFCNIYFWVYLNGKKGSKKHLHEGKYWTYNSVNDFVEQYTFWTPSMVKRILLNLKKGGYTEEGNFNRYGPDKTKWYTITQKGIDIVKNNRGTAEIDNWNSE